MGRSFSMAWTVFLFSSALGCAGGGGPSMVSETRACVIYGQDDREEPYAYAPLSPIYTWAQSAAIQIDTSSLKPAGKSGFALAVKETLAESMRASGKPLCPEEPFQEEPVLDGVCSAFLVGPDTIVTAGHCINAELACPRAAFVFGAGYNDESRDLRQIDQDNVYFCEGVLTRVASGLKGDYAVVKLDRPVAGHAPLPLRRTGKIADDEELVLIGYPLGLPTKIAAHGKVIDNTPDRFFTANTDSYGGGSGSVVMGVHSGLVEGVLVRGEDDFAQKGDCWMSKVCPEEASPCRGEDASRATEFAAYVP